MRKISEKQAELNRDSLCTVICYLYDHGSGVMIDTRLPESFEELEPFLQEWGSAHDIAERYQVRQGLSFERLHAFHKAMAPRLEEVFVHLDRFSYRQLPPPEDALFTLALGLTEAAQAVEIFGEPCVPSALPGHAVEIRIIAAGKGKEARGQAQ